MESKKTEFLNRLNKILSDNEKIVEHKVSKTVLKQTGLFFTSLVILIGVWTAGFGFVINLLMKNKDGIINNEQQL